LFSGGGYINVVGAELSFGECQRPFGDFHRLSIPSSAVKLDYLLVDRGKIIGPLRLAKRSPGLSLS
jgi:hypothetical protein